MKMIIKKSILIQVSLNLLTILIVVSLLSVTGVLATPASQMQVPGFIPYQGHLVDVQNEPVNSLIDMTFSLYANPEGGTALWKEIHTDSNAVPVAEGLFQVFLGSLTPIPPEVWNQSQLFLGVQVGSDSEMMPRQPVGGVPMALQANVALTVPDSSITSSKAALTHGEIYGSGEVLTLTDTPQIIPSLSFSVNPSTPQVLQISVSLDAAHAYPQCVTLLASPFVDDIQIGPVMTLSAGVRTTISTTRQANLTSGFHEVSFKAWCESGSGSVIMTGQSSVSYLLFSQ